MNFKKTIFIMALLVGLCPYSNAQSIPGDDILLITKGTLDINDKISGTQTEVPVFNPDIIDDTDQPVLHWSVYPNPTNGNFVLWIQNLDSLETEVNLTYRLYDLNGNLLLNDIVYGEKTEIETELLTPAMYYLSVLTEKSIKSFKIIKY